MTCLLLCHTDLRSSGIERHNSLPGPDIPVSLQHRTVTTGITPEIRTDSNHTTQPIPEFFTPETIQEDDVQPTIIIDETQESEHSINIDGASETCRYH